jgi:mannosylglycerate hydrolase
MTTLHLISHTHWDREWYLPYQEFRLKLVLLIDRLLAILQTDPNYRTFLLDGQTIVLDDYLELRPERAAELKELIQAGRLQIGPWHILPDEFLVSPEATIRNLLQGERTARRFGKRMPVGYIPDPFGHIAQMPQILQGFEIETACVQRGLADEPCEFWWQAPDGSRVLMAYLRDGYGNAAGLPVDQPERFVEQVARLRDSLVPHAASRHLVLMHGTDHQLPSAATPHAIAYANQHLPDDRLVHSCLPEYLQAIQAELDLESLPVISGELRSPKRSPLLPGVLSARVWIKQRNQACQSLLERWVEPLSVWASLTAEPDPAAGPYLGDTAPIIRRAWRLLMENHPHDSICGCSIDQVHAEMRPRFDQVEQIGERLVAQSLDQLAEIIDTRPPADLSNDGLLKPAILVFNPHSTTQSGTVEVQLAMPYSGQGLEVVDDQGQAVPGRTEAVTSREISNHSFDRAGMMELLGALQDGRVTGLSIQNVEISPTQAGLYLDVSLAENLPPNPTALEAAAPVVMAALADDRVQRFHVHASVRSTRIAFLAGEVPGSGWRSYWLRTPHQATQPAPEILPEPQIENELLRVRVDPTDGTLTLLDRRSSHTYTDLHRFSDGGDCGDEYNYAPPAQDELVTRPRVESLRAIRDSLGEHLEISLLLHIPAGLSTDRQGRSDDILPLEINSRISLAPGLPRLDFRTWVNNPARDHRLRVHFPVSYRAPKMACDSHFTVVERPLELPEADASWIEAPRPEVPQLAFADLSIPGQGLMLANRGLPEIAAISLESGSELALTLLRCVGWLSRDDFQTRRGHAGPMLATPGAQQIGQHQFDYALIPHGGHWQSAASLAYGFTEPLRAWPDPQHDEQPEFQLPGSGSFLQIEPDAFVLSAVKPAEEGGGWIGRGCNMSDQPIQVRVKPGLPYGSAWRANLSERRLEELHPGPDGWLTLDAGPWQIVTLRFSRLPEPPAEPAAYITWESS